MTDSLGPNKSLIAAAKKGDLAGVQKALESGADVNSCAMYPFRDHHGNLCSTRVTALGVSAFYGHLQVVQYLEEVGANPYLPFAVNHNERTPIEDARQTKNEVLVKYLDTIMSRPKWMNKIDDTTGHTPLTRSIFCNDGPKVQTLIDSGADVCKLDKHCKTPLIYAIEQNKLEIVQLLLKKGAFATGVSALKCALDLRSNDIVKCLIAYKPSLLVDEDLFDTGFTPLTKAISSSNLEIAKYLIENGADPEKPDLNGNTPLEKALEMPFLDIAEMLVLNGAKVPKTLPQSLFHKMSEDGNIQIYDFLLRNQWDVNQVDEDGKTSLALTATNENLLLSRFLIENGAKIALAQAEVEAFKKKNPHFNWFIKKLNEKNQQCGEAGQE